MRNLAAVCAGVVVVGMYAAQVYAGSNGLGPYTFEMLLLQASATLGVGCLLAWIEERDARRGA